MSQAKHSDTVKIHYTGKLKDGTVFDSSLDRDPLEFTIGAQMVIAGFEEAVIGMAPGDKKTETIPAENAYGPFRNELVHELSRDQFPADSEIAPGQRFHASAEGSDVVLAVIDATDDIVTVDANHPLAGKDLVFEIELVEIA